MIIALEGGEGCGKGTIAKWLNEEHGFIELHDPGSSPLSLQMREILLHKTDLDMDDRQLALAFEVCHADNLKQAMKYAANGSNVVLDRTYLSNYAHRMAKGMPMAHLKILNQLFLPETACVEKILYRRARGRPGRRACWPGPEAARIGSRAAVISSTSTWNAPTIPWPRPVWRCASTRLETSPLSRGWWPRNWG